jgi:Fic-DOC domain mobile mystery protein B
MTMRDHFGADGNATPLSLAERQALIPTYVTLRSELNELEQQNILLADSWAFGRKRKVATETFLRGLHRRMFGKVWRWAGRYRTTERNLGVPPHRIEIDLRQTLDDVRYWNENGTYAADEIAVRFHHRLVAIHPFPNGNGRWSRLAAELLIVQSGARRFSWGGASLQAPGDVRARYVEALRAADRHVIDLLMAFARS